MSIARVARTLAVTAVAGVLASTTYGAQAARAPVGPAAHQAHHARAHQSARVYKFAPPAPHKLRPGSTLAMGLHCDSSDMSM
jgi:hypothetical protein